MNKTIRTKDNWNKSMEFYIGKRYEPWIIGKCYEPYFVLKENGLKYRMLSNCIDMYISYLKWYRYHEKSYLIIVK